MLGSTLRDSASTKEAGISQGQPRRSVGTRKALESKTRECDTNSRTIRRKHTWLAIHHSSNEENQTWPSPACRITRPTDEQEHRRR